jgi:uncharacterized UPF0146 family protein
MWVMGNYKRIELFIARFIAKNYNNVVEIGIGNNPDVAVMLAAHGCRVRAIDIRPVPSVPDVPVSCDDIFSPRLSLYREADCIYAIRPGIEMIPPLIELARLVHCDLIVYHLGNEIYGDGGEILECGVILHRYYHPPARVRRDNT